MKIHIPNTKTKQPREFTITRRSIENIDLLEILRSGLHTPNIQSFLLIVNAPLNEFITFGGVPKQIAEFLTLPGKSEYTGYGFRRTSEYLSVDWG